MNAVNFRTADLNLFRVFVTLLEEKNATRAGERLGLSQSAISHALRRLRAMVGDDLFIRGQTGLRPTPRALEIAETARTALELLETAVNTQRFDPAVDHHVFTIAAGTYISYVLGPMIAERVMRVMIPSMASASVAAGSTRCLAASAVNPNWPAINVSGIKRPVISAGTAP